MTPRFWPEALEGQGCHQLRWGEGCRRSRLGASELIKPRKQELLCSFGAGSDAQRGKKLGYQLETKGWEDCDW